MRCWFEWLRRTRQKPPSGGFLFEPLAWRWAHSPRSGRFRCHLIAEIDTRERTDLVERSEMSSYLEEAQNASRAPNICPPTKSCVESVRCFLAWLRVNQRKPRLEAFFIHGSSHPIPQSQVPIHTHSLVVRNAGSYTATGVRISHSFVPQHTDIQVYPDRPKTVTSFGQNGSEILIDRLRPREQVTLSYLYPGPTLLTQFGTNVKFDDGFARFSEMQHVRVFPPWVRALILSLMFAGLSLVFYFVLKIGLYLLRVM